MDAFMNTLTQIVTFVKDLLWDYVLIFLLGGTGIYFTVSLKFIQIRKLKDGLKRVFGNININGNKVGKDGMSSFQALTTAVAAQVGTGNIAGAATAIAAGGPGAIFWMWVSAFFGMATIYSEAVLAQKYKHTSADGTEISLTAKPDTGYRFKEWQVVSGGVTITDGKFTMPEGNVEVKAFFEKDAPPAPTEFIVTFDGNGGTSSVGSMTTTDQKLTSLPSASRRGSYSFDGWYTAENGGIRITTSYEFSADTTVYAHWTYTGGNSSGGGYTYYTIKATAGVNGAISPSGSVSVRSGKDQTFTITPDKGYAISDVKIDGKSVGAVKSYTFENVKGNHTIEAIFMKANGDSQTGVFVDVPEGSYYEEAVAWAVENGITKGTSDTTFEPNGICTRAQAVTFLWRAAGSPAPKSSTMPFTDVKAGSYYYDAVLWAVENGITKGTSDTTFSPDVTCSRAQIVTFLWRSQEAPAAGAVNPFTDVKADAYYAEAVLWAVKEDVTKGTTDTTFSPNADCTRAQIVTFIWRALAE